MSSKTALVLLDAQVNMFEESTGAYNAQAILKGLRELLLQARQRDIDIFHLQHNGGEGDPDEPGTPGWFIHPDLAPQRGETVLQKSLPDAFAETNLDYELRSRNIIRLVLAGMQSELCIHATLRRAVDLGYEVLLVGDGHSTFHSEDIRAPEMIELVNEELSSFARVLSISEVDFTDR
jgi:nicotinamidase-related amidase